MKMRARNSSLLWGMFLAGCALLFTSCATYKEVPPPPASSQPVPSEGQVVDRAKEAIAPTTEVGQGKLPSGLEIQWPLKEPVITEYFGWRKKSRRRSKTNLRMHDGVDLKAYKNTPVYAAADGEVIYAARRVRSYGKMIVLDCGNGWSTVYAHLNDYKVKVGQSVKRGDLIALSGRTGRATGPHLHFEIRRAADPLDPLLFLPPIESTKPKETN